MPSIDRAPATVTAMLPLLPKFVVSVLMWPSGPMDKLPAVTITLPPFPGPCVSLEMPPKAAS